MGNKLFIAKAFVRGVCSFTLLAWLATTGSLTFSLAVQGQSIARFPLILMKIMIVPEKRACLLPEGYDSKIECPTLKIDYVNSLQGKSVSTKPIPPGQTVELGESIFSDLYDYREKIRRSFPRRLPPENRKAVIVVYDFGNPEESPKPDLDLILERSQEGKDCRGNNIPRQKPFRYKSLLPAKHQYWIYHESADSFIPCASVRWKLIAKQKITGIEYPSWEFITAR
jgi:hypothetical protein